ncbi:hypothetical protein F4776DRAFT_91536 [Hypoxylon sp. NC0597]|nr:hypothetical protein F4776DRAFT_91536 [Hypoxylon sp. NC0597]
MRLEYLKRVVVGLVVIILRYKPVLTSLYLLSKSRQMSFMERYQRTEPAQMVISLLFSDNSKKVNKSEFIHQTEMKKTCVVISRHKNDESPHPSLSISPKGCAVLVPFFLFAWFIHASLGFHRTSAI